MEDVRGFKVVDLYVEHKVEEISIEDVIFEEDNGEGANDEVNVEGANNEVNVEGANDEVNVEGANDEVNVEGANDEVNVEGANDEVNVEGANDEEVSVDGVDEEVNVNVDDVDDESETDPYYSMGSEDDEEEDEDLEDEIDVMNLGVDASINWKTVLPNAEKPSKLDDNSDNGSDSDVLQTPPDSDAEGDTTKFPIFREPTKLEVRMMFKDKQQIKDAIKEYAMENKKNLVFKKNDKKRMVVKCVDGCPFHIRFSMRTTLATC
ncbi:unnamed protein product [Lathyrus sativus]|nr:unnamed protein product [Lathyrus sativus]